MKTPTLVLAVLIQLAATGLAQTTTAPEVLLKSALQREQIDGDVDGALADYRRIVERFPTHVSALKALQQMAAIYEGRRDDATTTETYRRIVRDFPNTDAARAASAKISQVQSRQTASGVAQPKPLDPVAADTRLGFNWVPSPDGGLAASVDDPGLVVHDLHANTHRVLVRHESAEARVRDFSVWSPDGRKGAFVRRETGAAPAVEIRVIDIATAAVTVITGRPNGSAGAVAVRAWTTQDELVFTVGQQDVFFIPAAGGTLTKLTLPESTQFGDVTPDGSALIIVGRERMSRLDRKTGREDILTRGFEVATPRVSRDGRLIAYLAKESASWSLRVAPLSQAGAIERSVQIAEVPPPNVMLSRFLRWSAGGRLTLDAQVNRENLYGLRLTDGGARPDAKVEKLVHESWSAGWPEISPDSRLIAYATAKGLAVMNADGSGERDVVEGAVPLGWLSADEVVFSTAVNEGVFAVSIQTGATRSIGHDAPVNAIAGTGSGEARASFQYSPARNQIVTRHITDDEQARFLVREPGGQERVLLEMPVRRPGPLPTWRVSPLGDRLAYVPRESAPQGAFTLRVRSFARDDDKAVGQIGSPDSISWTSDGRRLVYAAPSNTLEIRQYDVETGESSVTLDARHVAGIFPPDARGGIRRCVLASDRSFVACSTNVTTTERSAWAGVTHEAVTLRLGRR